MEGPGSRSASTWPSASGCRLRSRPIGRTARSVGCLRARVGGRVQRRDRRLPVGRQYDQVASRSASPL